MKLINRHADFLYISAKYVAIFREVAYEGRIPSRV